MKKKRVNLITSIQQKRNKKHDFETNIYNLEYELNPKPNGLAFVVHLSHKILL